MMVRLRLPLVRARCWAEPVPLPLMEVQDRAAVEQLERLHFDLPKGKRLFRVQPWPCKFRTSVVCCMSRRTETPQSTLGSTP